MRMTEINPLNTYSRVNIWFFFEMQSLFVDEIIFKSLIYSIKNIIFIMTLKICRGTYVSFGMTNM